MHVSENYNFRWFFPVPTFGLSSVTKLSDCTFIHSRLRTGRMTCIKYYLFLILMALLERRLFPLSALTALFAGECARSSKDIGQQRSGSSAPSHSAPSQKVTELRVMEMVYFLQDNNKMRIKMNGVNHWIHCC